MNELIINTVQTSLKHTELENLQFTILNENYTEKFYEIVFSSIYRDERLDINIKYKNMNLEITYDHNRTCRPANINIHDLTLRNVEIELDRIKPTLEKFFKVL